MAASNACGFVIACMKLIVYSLALAINLSKTKNCIVSKLRKLINDKIYFLFPEPPKLVVNEKRYGRKSKPDTSYSEDLYSADDESLVDSRTESQTSMKLTNGVSEKHEEETHQKVRKLLQLGQSSCPM